MKKKHNKKNVKFYIKKNIISFLIGIIIFGGVGVYAAVTFPSNDVTYDNTESGLKSKDVQGAIDELYTECTKEPTAGETIIEDAGLEKDPYECRYFFTGANPNNYITFNDEKAGWRIISVECDGTIKIMRTVSIGNQAWDSSNSNNWANASLNTYLNETYYNGLNATAQNQIVAKDWSIGAVSNNNDLANTIEKENGKKWNGKVALVTASEYVRSNSNKSSCGTVQQLWNATSGQCKGTTWMFYSNNWWWTLSPYSGSSKGVFFVEYGGGSFDYNSADFDYAVRPTLYLSSEIKITGGTGTSSDPYQISQ